MSHCQRLCVAVGVCESRSAFVNRGWRLCVVVGNYESGLAKFCFTVGICQLASAIMSRVAKFVAFCWEMRCISFFFAMHYVAIALLTLSYELQCSGPRYKLQCTVTQIKVDRNENSGASRIALHCARNE